MPRSDAHRIDRRIAIDSSKSANVPLRVTANLNNARPFGSAARNMAAALSRLGNQGAHLYARQHNIQAAEQKKADTLEGTSQANEAAVTGEKPVEWLEAASDDARKAYQTVDGVNQASQFWKEMAPVLSKAEPGTDVDALISEHAQKYITDHELSGDTEHSFYNAIARAQPSVKLKFTKQSLVESAKREEEAYGANLTAGITDGSYATPKGFAAWKAKAKDAGLSDTEIHSIALESVKALVYTGEVDPEETLKLLPDSVVNVPENKEALYQAAAHGKRVRAAKQQEAQFKDRTDAMIHYANLSDKGIAPVAQLEATAQKFGLSSEWVVSNVNRARSAREQQAKADAKAKNAQEVATAWASGDPIAIAAVGLSKVKSYGSKIMADAYRDGDQARMTAIIKTASTLNAPLPFFNAAFSQFDPSDVKNAERLIALRDTLRSVSDRYAEANTPAGVSAMFKRYDTLTNVLGMTEGQALTKLAQVHPIMDQGAAHAVARKALKENPDAIPTDFDDGSVWHLKGDTAIANMGYVNASVEAIATELARTGAYSDPAEIAEHAKERFLATHVREGNKYVPVPSGVSQEVGDAFTELSADWKKKLVKNGQLSEDADVYFLPSTSNSGKWVLMRNDLGVPRPVVHYKNKKASPVVADAHAVTAHFGKWKHEKQINDMLRRNRQDTLKEADESSWQDMFDRTGNEQNINDPEGWMKRYEKNHGSVEGSSLSQDTLTDYVMGTTGAVTKDPAKLKGFLEHTETPGFLQYLKTQK